MISKGTKHRAAWSLIASLAVAALACAASVARADRIVLAPSGTVLLPDSLRAEYLARLDRGGDYVGWLAVRLPEALYGVELEAERFDLGNRRRETFSVQYPLTSEAFSDVAPALSVGVRDALNRGREGRAFFIAATKSFGVSQWQETFLRDLKLHAGYGSSRMGGGYLGASARLLGLNLSVEYVARRFNAGVGLPFARFFQLKAYALENDVFVGASFMLAK